MKNKRTNENTRQDLQQALDILSESDIVRKRVDTDTGEEVWLLYHDYLSSGVLELDRRARYWSQFLEESTRVFNQAPNLWQKWKSLLSPLSQLKLIYERINKRIAYDKSRKFALWSTLRIGINIWVLVGCISFYFWNSFHIENQSSRIFSPIGLKDNIAPEEIKALWELSRSHYAIRQGVLEHVLQYSGNAWKFNRRASYVIQALVGLNQDYRSQLINDVMVTRCYKNQAVDQELMRACLSLITELKDFSPEAIEFLIWAITQTNDSDQLRSLAYALGNLGTRLSHTEAKKVLEQIIKIREKFSDPLPFASLFRKETAPLIVDVLKWPTSVEKSRPALIQKFRHFTSEAPQSKEIEKTSELNIWEFVASLEKQKDKKYDLKSHP